MNTMLMFLAGMFILGIAIRDKPVWWRWVATLLVALYMTYAYFAGGAQF